MIASPDEQPPPTDALEVPAPEDSSPSSGAVRELLRRTADHAADWLEGLDTRPVGATAGTDRLRAALGGELAEEGVPDERVVDDLVVGTAGGLLGNAGGAFFGWVMGGALPAALAADWLTSTWDQNAALHAASPAEAVLEETAGRWLKQVLGLPAEASFAVVSGGQLAHVTALAAARHHLLAGRGWDVQRRGLAGAPPIQVLAGEHRHVSIDRALRLLGFGTDSLRAVPVDGRGGVDVGRLGVALEESAAVPVLLCLQAGDLNTGSYDDFAGAIALARRHGEVWVHVDGAFGLWAAASPRFRHLVAGVAAADSWTTDGHKWLNTPFDCGYVVVRHPDAHSAAMSVRAAYLIHGQDGVRDPMDWTPEWSRRGRGVATYAALRSLGRRGLADLVERCCDAARDLTLGIAALPGAELLVEPVVNQGLVRFPDPSGVDDDAHTDRVVAAVQGDGAAWFGGTTWRGQRAMRISVCSWRTGPEHVRRSVDAVARVLDGRQDR